MGSAFTHLLLERNLIVLIANKIYLYQLCIKKNFQFDALTDSQWRPSPRANYLEFLESIRNLVYLLNFEIENFDASDFGV